MTVYGHARPENSSPLLNNIELGAFREFKKMPLPNLKFISFEPLLRDALGDEDLAGISWVIIGARTQPSILPKLQWVDHILREARTRNIPVFLKDNLVPLLGKQFVAKHRATPFTTAKIST